MVYRNINTDLPGGVSVGTTDPIGGNTPVAKEYQNFNLKRA